MGGPVFPPCWLFGLRCPSTGEVQAVWWYQVSVPKWQPLGELTLMGIPWGICHQCPCLHSEPQLTPTSPGDPPRPTGGSGPGSYGVTALPWVPVHMKPCVHPPRVESLFPPILWSSCTQALLAFKAKCSGGSSFWCQMPSLGSLTWGLELSLLRENLCNIIIFHFVGRPPNGYGIWLYQESAPPTISLWLLCLWVQNIFFGRFEFFLLTFVRQLVVILVFLWEELNWSPSTLPSCLSLTLANCFIWWH